MQADLEDVVKQYHQAVAAFVTGDSSPQERLFSRREDVTLANPLGRRRGGGARCQRLCTGRPAQLSDGEMLGFERVSGSSEGDLAYIHEIERARVKVGGARQKRLSSLRVTTIFKREQDDWKILHRHADPITTLRSIESTLQD
jgi:ketosteroid isomerase-like protein